MNHTDHCRDYLCQGCESDEHLPECIGKVNDHLSECTYAPESFDPERNSDLCDAATTGYIRGLDAAREAVDALQSMTGLLGKADALAAIDALREEQK